jgi:hypothetical protein
MHKGFYSLLLLAVMGLVPVRAGAQSFTFSTGNPDGKIATGSRPDSPGKQEIESADDFILSQPTSITGGTFIGLLPSDLPLSGVSGVDVEIYRVFPKDSTVPASGNAPTRANSPSDVVFDDRGSVAGDLAFTTTLLNPSFTAANSVLNGIHPVPNQTTGGEGPVTGQEVLFDVDFIHPFNLPADHYFFIPQVQLTNGDFLWLSAPKPIVAPGTPFTPDLQSWIRDAELDPDWLRIGTDIVGGSPAPTYNAAFSLRGEVVPEPSSLTLLLGIELTGAGLFLRRFLRR